MIILVANIGSTSFKFRLFDMTDGQKAAGNEREHAMSERDLAMNERELARGGVDRIGLDDARVKVGDKTAGRYVKTTSVGPAAADEVGLLEGAFSVPAERMLTLERSLAMLVRSGKVTALEAEKFANHPLVFLAEIKRAEQPAPEAG